MLERVQCTSRGGLKTTIVVVRNESFYTSADREQVEREDRFSADTCCFLSLLPIFWALLLFLSKSKKRSLASRAGGEGRGGEAALSFVVSRLSKLSLFRRTIGGFPLHLFAKAKQTRLFRGSGGRRKERSKLFWKRPIFVGRQREKGGKRGE